MTTEWYFQFDTLPKSLNVKLRKHYFVRKAENENWACEVMHQLRGRLPEVPLQKCKIKVIRHNYRMLDFDGFVGSLKPVIDAFKTCKLIQDDSWGVTGQWECDQVFRPKWQGPLLEVWIVAT